MGVSDRLRRFAFARPKAFVVVGWDGEGAFLELVRRGVIESARAPHDADLLLLCGRIPGSWSAALQSLFETLALPRSAVWLRPDRDAAPPEGLPLQELDRDRPDREALLQGLLDATAPNNRPILPDQPPSPWRGEGDHGQGGEGMMGGKPYGRPTAMVGGDPDGLMLGALPTALGPFFPGLPCGLQLQLTLQGERIASVDDVINWFPPCPAAEAPETVALRAARGEEIAAATLEHRRILSHLRAMARLLELAGLAAAARRLLMADTTEPRQLRRLFRAAE